MPHKIVTTRGQNILDGTIMKAIAGVLVTSSSHRATRWAVVAVAMCSLAGLLALGCRTGNGSESGKANAWVKSWRAANPTWRGVHLMAHNDEQITQLIDALPKLVDAGMN